MIKSISNLILYLPLMFNFLMIMLLTVPSYKKKIHPMIYMMLLVMLTFIISLKMNLNFYSWLPFILFLTMIGGLMIIIIYIVSLSNNELFTMNFFMINLKILKILILLIIFSSFIYFYLPLINFINIDIINNSFHMEENNMNLLYKKFYNLSTLFIMTYLFMSLIIIIKICFINQAPLRQTIN